MNQNIIEFIKLRVTTIWAKRLTDGREVCHDPTWFKKGKQSKRTYENTQSNQ